MLLITWIGLACATPPSPITPTPIPTPVPSGALTGVVWAGATPIGAAGGTALPALAASDGRIFLVGAIVGDELAVSLWTTFDGVAWVRSRDPNVNGLDIADVATRPGRFVAVALPPNEFSRGGILTSADGSSWHMVVERDGLVAVASGPLGFVVLDQKGVLLSSDGQNWRAVTALIEAPVTAPGGAWAWTDVAAAPWGWVAIGGTGTVAVVWTSTDGIDWRLAAVDEPRSERATGGSSADRVACSERSCLVTGSEWDTADVGWRVAWSSVDGRAWARLGDDGAPSNARSSRVTAWGDRLLIVLDGRLLVSDDGSTWRPIPTTGLPQDVAVIDASAVVDALLVVGRARMDSSGLTHQVVAVIGRPVR